MSSDRRWLLAVRDLRLLRVGDAISAVGDQFLIVALPWLTLAVARSAAALGSVLAVMAIPRAGLMLVGGVYVDSRSRRRVMLAAKEVRRAAVAPLGTAVLLGCVITWMHYAFALVLGLPLDAFFHSTQDSVVPVLVGSDDLERANPVVQGTGRLAVLIGPALAGVVLAMLTRPDGSAASTAIGTALARCRPWPGSDPWARRAAPEEGRRGPCRHQAGRCTSSRTL